MMPMPDMKPDTTVYGIRVTYLPRRSTPSRIWNSPARITTVKAMAMPLTGSEATSLVITAVKTTVIGPVGSDIRQGEPPNSAANSPTSIAP